MPVDLPHARHSPEVPSGRQRAPLECGRIMQEKEKNTVPLIAENRKARHEYFIEDHYEAGLALAGWEVKSLRAGRAQLKESYVFLRDGEAWLFGAHFSPLTSASTHV